MFRLSTKVLLSLVGMSLAFVTVLEADDRELLRDTTADPYVFIVMDNSGSMHRSAPCGPLDAALDIDPWDGVCTSVCPLDDPSCAQVCPNFGCIEYSVDADEDDMIEITVDNVDATLEGAATNWTLDLDTYSTKIGDDFAYVPEGSTGAIVFEADLPEDGEYHVFLQSHRIRNNDEAIDARVTVTHAGGSNYQEVDMEARDISSQFNYIGTFDFLAAQTAVVRVDNETTGDEIFDQGQAADGTPQAVIADAVRFYRMPEPAGGAASACVANGWRCEQPLCPSGGCQTPLGGDDPTSKFFQAKQALYEVLGQVDGVHFGFSTYEQDDSAMIYKHYLYRVRETQADGITPQQTFNDVLDPADQLQGFDWPMIGAYEVFGTGAPYDSNGNTEDDNLRQENQWNCGTDFNDIRGDAGFEDDHWIGCTAVEAADVEDIWEVARFLRIPRLGRTASSETRLYIRDIDDTVYRIDIEYQGFNDGLSSPAYAYGDAVFGVQYDLHRCTNANCSSSDQLYVNLDAWYDFAGEYSDANVLLSRRNNPTSYFQRNSTVYNGIMAETPGTACFDRGLEPNNDLFYRDEPYDDFVSNLQDDAWWDYAHKWPWRFDDRGDKNVDGMDLTGISSGDSIFHDGNRDRVLFMDYGDFVPLDWETRNIDIIRRHLAPNAWEVASGEDPDESITVLAQTGEIPDFRSSVYFKDTYDENPSNNRRRLRLKDESERPILASGMTPLNGALTDFQLWYQGGPNQSCDLDPGENPTGWCQYAAVFDLNWNCKQKYVLLITDGDETCDLPGTGENYPACDTAADLLGDGVQTFVVGFGLPELEDENALQCMAEQGGTGDPILPRNKDELVEALLSLFSQVKAEQRSFASASIPAVQSSAADSIFLSSFTPLPGAGFWPGRIDVFRQPLPLTDDLRPDVTTKCSDERQSSCHLYDVAERILDQAPDDDTVDNEGLATPERFKIQIGADDVTTDDADEELLINVSSRRVFYGMDNPSKDRTQPLRLLWPNDFDDPNADPYRLDLAEVLVPADEWVDYNVDIAACDPDVSDCSAIEEELDDDLQFTVAQLLRKKQQSIVDSEGNEIQCTGDPTDTSEPCTYVMGDVFHANPQVVNSANDFDFFRQDLCGTPLPDGTPTSCVPANEFSSAADMRNRGYREFTRRTTWRRRMLATATNDGQLHFFDAGKYIQVENPSDPTDTIDVFTDGTGYELFSYIPRMVMPIIRDQANQGDEEAGEKHIFSMDGSPKTADVFIDPLPNEFGEYENVDREWRTVMIGGVREAGDFFDQANHVLDFRSGYYALDLTQPDPMVQATDDAGNVVSEFAPWVPRDPGKFLPQCLTASTETGLQTPADGCETQAGDRVPFPLELWTFQDTIEVDGVRYPLDEDINGFRDLASTWSTPVIGQIMICNGGNRCRRESSSASDKTDLETRWVAIFGGGMDAEHKNNPVMGDWIYFLDIETGDVIYKRQLDGAVPSDPAVLDTDNDGILDLVYIGTTAGKLYKIDLTALESSGKVPSVREREIGDAKIIGWEDLDYTVDPPVPVPDPAERKFTVERIIHDAWDPFVIFDVGEPIYYPPALFRIPELEEYGFTVASGDREDLWEENGEIGYFVTGVDQSFTKDTVGLPITVDDLARFPWDSTEGVYTDSAGDEQTITAERTIDLLTNTPASRPGWAMIFPEEFRATGEPFVLSGILVFSMFEPLNFTIEDLGGDDDDGTVDTQTVCSRSGTTYAFVVFLNSSAPLLVEEDDGLDGGGGGGGGGGGDCDGCGGGGGDGGGDGGSSSTCGGRCDVINEFTTAIHTESSVSKNPINTDEDGDETQTSFTRPQTEREKALADAIREAVLDLSPRTCQFNEKYEILIEALKNSTGLNVYARVPLLVCPGDWKN